MSLLCAFCRRLGPTDEIPFVAENLCSRCSSVAFRVNGEIFYVPTFKQEEFHSSNQANVLFYGGRGSGKSRALRADAHMRALSVPNFKYIILRRTYPELSKSHLIDIPREMKILGGEWSDTKKIAKYPNGSKGFFSHCQSSEDVLNLLSAEFYAAYFDEISTFEWEMFTKLSASVRVPEMLNLKALVRCATNPLGASADQINRYFVLKDITPEEDQDYTPDDWHSIRANIEDNPHLDKDEYRKRFAGLSDHVRKAWLDGEFGLENALFDFRPTWEGKPYHVINELPTFKTLPIIYQE